MQLEEIARFSQSTAANATKAFGCQAVSMLMGAVAAVVAVVAKQSLRDGLLSLIVCKEVIAKAEREITEIIYPE